MHRYLSAAIALATCINKEKGAMTLDITCIDLFCGAGGSTTGAIQAGATVKLAVNHWDRAIETHNTNYPNIDHILTDISTADPRRYPKATILIATPECTNQSIAKGAKRKNLGQATLWEPSAEINPAEERSRCTMWDPLRFCEQLDHQIVILENVVDARYWRMWDAWLHAWKSLDYDFEIVYYNSQFAHPTPQSRDRMYFIAWKRKNRKPDLKFTPSAYCHKCEKDILAVQSWKKPTQPYGKYGKMGQYVYRCPECTNQVTPYYYAAANAIDWSLPIQRIADREKPLAEKTTRRIRHGLEKFSREPFTVQVNKTSDRFRSLLHETLPTQTGDNGLAMVVPFILSLSHNTGEQRYVYQALGPLPTQTARQDLALAIPPFIAELHGTSTARSVTEPLATVCASGGHHGVVVPPFLLDHLAEYRPRDITGPLSTVCASGNHHSLIIPPMQSWLMTYYNHGKLAPTHEAVPTVRTVEGHGLVTSEKETLPIAVEDCSFRMLTPKEIQAAMAFPNGYIVTGNQKEQVAQLGNAVTPPVMKLLMERVLASLS